MAQKLIFLVLFVLHECAQSLNLDFLTKSLPNISDDDEEGFFELLTDGEDEEVERGRQLVNVVTIATFNSSLLQLGRGTIRIDFADFRVVL